LVVVVYLVRHFEVECNSSPHLYWYHEKRFSHQGDTGKSAVALYAEYVPRRQLLVPEG